MSRTLLFLVGLGMLVAVLPNASADDGGLKIPNFNPFSEDEEKVEPRSPSSGRMTRKAAEEKTSEGGFAWPSYLKPKLPSLPKPSMPKLSVPSSSKPRSRRMEEPSTWEKINSGTKNILTSTKNTLMPWTADEKATTNRTTMRKQSTVKSSTRSKKPEKKSILSSWFSPKEDEKPIETVNDYLALPRVPY